MKEMFFILFTVTSILTAQIIFNLSAVFNGVESALIKNEIKKSKMVKIPNKNFEMDITEVTVAQFEECVKADKCSKGNYETDSLIEHCNYGIKGKENHPMNCLYQKGAEEFCKWVGKRLPTKDEWIYAAKGGKNYKYSGNNNADEVAWYNKNSNNSTHEVGTKKANEYGLYDMSGNVLEWTNATGVICGGAWSDDVNEIKINSDNICSAIAGINDPFGFRCILSDK